MTGRKQLDTEALANSSQRFSAQVVLDEFNTNPSHWIGEDAPTLAEVTTFTNSLKAIVLDCEEAVINLNNFLQGVAAEFTQRDRELSQMIGTDVSLGQHQASKVDSRKNHTEIMKGLEDD